MKKLAYVSILFLFGLVAYLSIEILSLGANKDKNEGFEIANESKCNLQIKDCAIGFDDSTGEISMTPRPFYLNQKIEVNIIFKTSLKRNLSIDLKGLDMDMGYNRYQLKSIDDKRYRATFFLPTCTKDYMPWQMAILKKEIDKSKVNLFKFLAEKK